MRCVIVGGGVGGLASALLLARDGHEVTVLEQDAAPAAADVEAAFVAERQGAPQVHQTHGFLARLVVELRERLPDVLADLLDAGCVTMPTTANLGEPREGDEDLRVLIVRRTTFEWVLRRAALAEPGVRILHDVTVEGLAGTPASDGAPAAVTGVLTETGRVEADVVALATGRRGPVGQWLAPLGVAVDETIVESGLMYLSRWYRLTPGATVELDPKLGGDLGFVKYLAVPGDGDTLSVTLAVRTDDRELRRALSDPDGFELACRNLPGPDRFFAGGDLEPIGGVRPMTGLINRRRRFVADGAPLAVGVHALGDAHTCTNPLYGRGCSLALVQAGLLADAVAAHPDDATARALAYEAASVSEVEPWFDVSVEWDRLGADPASALADAGDAGKGLAAVFAAAATDPVIGRGIVRLFNLMATPAELMTDPELLQRIMEVVAEPDAYPPPPREGPTRTELLAILDGGDPMTSSDPGDELAGSPR